jgi:hypothetical protein
LIWNCRGRSAFGVLIQHVKNLVKDFFWKFLKKVQKPSGSVDLPGITASR